MLGTDSENKSEEMEVDDTVSICRLCAEMTSSKSLIPLYTEQKEEQPVTKQINELIGNLISPNDDLSQEVCLHCAENVSKCYAFVSRVIETQNKLRRMVPLPESKSKTEDTSCDNETEFLNNHEQTECQIVFRPEDLKEGTQQISDKVESSSNVFADLDDFVELLVVHPDEMVDVDLQNILKSENELDVDKNSQSVVASSPDNYILYMKEENIIIPNDNIRDDETKTVVKSQIDESIFLENYQMNETSEEKWYQNEYPEEAAILYKCSGCGQTFESESLFQSHSCEVDTDAIYKCSDCDELFDSEQSFELHNCTADQDENSSRKMKHFKCDLCNRTFKSELVFKLHVSQHKKSVICHMCDAVLLDENSLLNHIREKHQYWDYEMPDPDEITLNDSEKQCDICGKITDNLKQHKMYHTIKELEYCKEVNKKFLKKWFYCQICNKKIFSEANYLFHMAKHEGDDTVPCRRCDFVAINIQDYNMHLTTHTGGKYFICNECDKCFFTRSAISDHVLVHMEGTRYMCEICGKRFKTSRSNAQHKLLQHKKYFRCNRCNRGFTHESKLKNHYNICQVINHEQCESKVFEPVERFFCNICNTNIKSSSEISILFHKAKHEGKDGVECRFCNFLCKNACMYKNHLLIHTNQRPYACTQCPKSFRTKGCLVQHMLVHGDEYKYQCEYCGKKSKKLTTHVNHVNIHTDTKPYKCPDCARPFRQLSDMKKHRRTHVKYVTDTISDRIAQLPYMTIKNDVEDMIAAESIQQLQLV